MQSSPAPDLPISSCVLFEVWLFTFSASARKYFEKIKTIGLAKLTSSRLTNLQLYCLKLGYLPSVQVQGNILKKKQNNRSCKAHQLQINQSAAVYCLKFGYLPSVHSTMFAKSTFSTV